MAQGSHAALHSPIPDLLPDGGDERMSNDLMEQWRWVFARKRLALQGCSAAISACVLVRIHQLNNSCQMNLLLRNSFVPERLPWVSWS